MVKNFRMLSDRDLIAQVYCCTASTELELDLIRRLEAAGQEISAVRTPDQFEAELRADEEKFRKLIKEAKISLDSLPIISRAMSTIR